jgi:hypothetical protein
MNYRELLLGAWAVGAFAWIAIRYWRGNFMCFYGSFPWCEYWTTSPWWSSTYFETLVDAFAVPLVGLIIVLAAIWLKGGFRKSPPRG